MFPYMNAVLIMRMTMKNYLWCIHIEIQAVLVSQSYKKSHRIVLEALIRVNGSISSPIPTTSRYGISKPIDDEL